MDAEGYPEQHELDFIENCNYRNIFSLIDYIEERWTYNNAMKMKWGKSRFGGKKDVLYLELHTIGWSGNESLVNAFLSNQMVKMLWYVKWERGGHHYFEISPMGVGFKKVSEMSKEKGISRQRIHHDKESYEWITIGDRTKMCREKSK